MGRYDLRPAKVLQVANRFIETQSPKSRPPWHQALTNIPPAEILVRPVQRFTDTRRKAKGKKPSKMFQPLPLTYPEDRMRDTFFNDHPWELARPKVVLENTGDDAKGWDWKQGLEQKGKPVDGESVVQRQSQLISSSLKSDPSADINLATELAYDQARKEFYRLRLRQDIEREVAKEEAVHYGAYFLPSTAQRSMYKEDEAYERWKKGALEKAEMSKHQMATAYSESGFVDEAELEEEELEVGGVKPQIARGEEMEESGGR